MNEIRFRMAVLEDLPTLYEFEQGIVEAERPFDDNLMPGRINYYDIKEMIESSDTDRSVQNDLKMDMASKP